MLSLVQQRIFDLEKKDRLCDIKNEKVKQKISDIIYSQSQALKYPNAIQLYPSPDFTT